MRSRSEATAKTLLIGVILSGTFLLLGLVMELVDPSPIAPIEVHQLRLAYEGIRSFDPVMIIHLGLIGLMLTPLARVVTLIGEFLAAREYPFVLISVGVLFLLGASVIIGLIQEGS